MGQFMDLKLYISILRMHSEQLGKLATELSGKLDALEQKFAEEEHLGESHSVDTLKGMTELNNSLFAATDLFYHRLHQLLSTTVRETGSSSES
jgi:hypothetical protein